MPGSPPPREQAPRQWGKTADTRRSILAAAEEVFLASGYSGASIADVVERSGSSVGSIYHHFGGKAELFYALWRRYDTGVAADIDHAEREATGDDAPHGRSAFIAGCAVYLRHVWLMRRAAALFIGTDLPPGFEERRRELNAVWIQRSAKTLGLSDSAADRFVAAAIMGVLNEATRAIVDSKRASQARDITNRAIEMLESILGQR